MSVNKLLSATLASLKVSDQCQSLVTSLQPLRLQATL